ncbi:MAG: hypothetical protein HY660_04620 [Armatimonadetes bacterium]|nr:hypothetical protein [Armatimonadota bacterium]
MPGRLSTGVVVLLLAGAAWPAAGQPAAADPCGVRGGTVRFAIHRDPIGFDPHVNYGATSSSLQGNVYDSLVQYDAGARIAPALAEAWTTPDPRTYVFKLREGVTFHDGSPFTAQDVQFSFQRVQDPKTSATRRRDLDRSLESVTVVDARTVRVRLKEPSATFLDMLAGREMYIVSRRWAERGDFRKAMNGTGPFRLVSHEPNVRYILERNPRYWAKGLPCLDRLELVPIQDDRARVNALKSQTVDFAEYIPWQEIEVLIRTRGYKVYRGYDVFNFVRLNPNRPPLNNPKVRQALNFAINRPVITQIAFGGQGQPMTGFLMRRGHWAYNPQTSNVWKHDPERARTLLREAGYARPQDLRLVFEAVNLSVHFDTAQVILTQLRQLGIQVDMRIIEVPTLFQKRVRGDYTMVMDGLSLPWSDPDVYSEYFHSTGTAYAAAVGFKSARLDELLAEGARISDREKRQTIYTEVEKILFQEAPWLFVLWRPQAEAGMSRVKGYHRMGDGLGTYSVGYLETLYMEK